MALLPLAALGVALWADAQKATRPAAERPLSDWCRCRGRSCGSFSGLFDSLEYQLGTPSFRRFVQHSAAQVALPWSKVERKVLSSVPASDVEYIVDPKTWPVYVPLAGLPSLPGDIREVMRAIETPDHPSVRRSASGRLALVKRVLPAWSPIKLHFVLNEAARHYSGWPEDDQVDGHVVFIGDIDIPVLFERERSGWTLWMSHTPNEVLSQLGHVQLARARALAAKRAGRPFHVVIGGLGIGWILTQIAALPGVTNVTLVEKNAELADLILPLLCGSLPASVGVQVRIGDLFSSTGGLEDADLAIVDIWPTYGDVTEDYDRLKRLLPKVPIEVWGSVGGG